MYIYLQDVGTFETYDEYYKNSHKSPTRIYVREIMENTAGVSPKRLRPNRLPSLSRAAPVCTTNNAGETIDSYGGSHFGSGYLEYSTSITNLNEVRQSFINAYDQRGSTIDLQRYKTNDQ